MIFTTISNWIRKVIRKMFGIKGTVDSTLNNQVAVSTEMENAITNWMDLYKGKLPWLKAGESTLGLPALIAAEIAKMVTLEMQVNITGDNERAKWLEKQYEQVGDNIRLIVEYACEMHSIKGGMTNCQSEMKKAVDCGYWNLFRYNPALKAEGKNPFTIDSKPATASYRDFIMNEARYSSLTRAFPDRAEALFDKAEKTSVERYAHLLRLKDLYAPHTDAE